jgi:hypothetical protein
MLTLFLNHPGLILAAFVLIFLPVACVGVWYVERWLER